MAAILRTPSYYRNVNYLDLQVVVIIGLRYQVYVSNYLKIKTKYG